MRTSTTGFLFAFAGSACATSESIDPGATRGGGMLLDDGGFPEAGMTGAGGDIGAGGFSAGGITSAGGFLAKGGAPTAGGAPPTAGGTTSAGGTTPGGAPPVTGGSPGGSGAPQGGAASCQADEKTCGGVCVRPAPGNGCGPQGCTACPTPAPTNGTLACINGQCDFNCLSGFTKSGSSCMGPTGGGGGGGGGGIMCNGQTCTNACPLSTQCCKSGGGCGCNIPLFGCQ
jgi:hypothetical protein